MGIVDKYSLRDLQTRQGAQGGRQSKKGITKMINKHYVLFSRLNTTWQLVAIMKNGLKC